MQYSPHQNVTTAVLPTDCLYDIISQFKSDRKQLFNLLPVNKFFFNTAVRHLYQYHAFNVTPDYPRKMAKLLSTIFVSLLQAAVKETIDTPGNNNSPSVIASEILGNLGLELVLPYQPSGITLLHRIYDSQNNYPLIESDPNVFSTMTIDYSKLNTRLSISQLQFFSLFRIKSSTINNESDKKNHSAVNPMVYPDLKLRPTDLHVYLMWMHFNCTAITRISLNIKDAQLYLPYASKLSNLKIIHLIKGETQDEPGFEAALAFIRENQSLFPEKGPLRISGWQEWEDMISLGVRPTNHNSYISAIRECRNSLLQLSKPTIALYETLKRPVEMNLSYVPNFYSMDLDIETDCLLELRDMDQLRYDMGEIKSMERFLQRCSKLKSLHIAIEHDDAFSWTSPERQSASGMPLMKLEELTISWVDLYHPALMALKDALSIFSSSLKCVVLDENQFGLPIDVPNYKRNLNTLRIIRYNHITEANIFGNFLDIIPNLTHLRLILLDAYSLNIGSLDNCPNLEHLEIVIGRDGLKNTRPYGEEPTSIPADNTLLDEGWRKGPIDHTLFSVWNLPKLKHLELGNLAALKFDFATLPLLHRLETLKILPHNQDIGDEGSYFRLQNKTLPGSESIPNYNSGPYNGIFGLHLHNKWSLPYLHSIKIKGFPSQVLCMETLRHLPALRSLSIDYRPSHKPRLHRFPFSDRLPDADCNQVFFESQLDKLEVDGNFFISSDDLASLLTIYAPSLKTLVARYIHLYEHHQDSQPYESETYSLLKAIKVADDKNFSCYTKSISRADEGKKQPGRHLQSIVFYGGITDEEQEELGLIKAEWKNVVLYKTRGIQHFIISPEPIYHHKKFDVFVRKSDYEVLQKDIEEVTLNIP